MNVTWSWLATSTSFGISGASSSGEIARWTSVKKCEAASREVMEIISPSRNGTSASCRPAGAPESRFSYHVFVDDAECDVAAHHIEAKDGSAAEVRYFRACLAEDFVATSSGAWCKNPNLLADDSRPRCLDGADRAVHDRGPAATLFSMVWCRASLARAAT